MNVIDEAVVAIGGDHLFALFIISLQGHNIYPISNQNKLICNSAVCNCSRLWQGSVLHYREPCVIAMVYCINLLSTYLLVHLTLAGLRPFGRVSHPLRHTARPIYHFHCAKTNIIKMGKIKALLISSYLAIYTIQTNIEMYLDAIASVGLHMSVGWSVSLFDFDDGTSVSKGIAAYGAILSCSLVN